MEFLNHIAEGLERALTLDQDAFYMALENVSSIIAQMAPPLFEAEHADEPASEVNLSRESRVKICGRFKEVLHHVTQRGLVGTFENKDVEGYSTEDFHKTLAVAPAVFGLVKGFLDKNHLVPAETRNEGWCDVIPVTSIVVLCLEHADEHPWTTETTVTYSRNILDQLCTLINVGSYIDLLLGQPESHIPGGVLTHLIKLMKEKLDKANWKNNPGVLAVYSYCVFTLRFPHMSEYFGDLLPPALLMVDTVKLDHRCLGVQCLHHIIKNTSKSELQWYGRAEVIYDALFHLLYHREVELVEVLYPCILDALKVVEPISTNSPHPYNRWDRFLVKLLTDMEMENLLVLRRAYCSQLPGILNQLGITLVCHYKRLFRVVFMYLEVYDGAKEEARKGILTALRIIIIQTWPRIAHYSSDITKAVLKFLTDLSGEEGCSCVTVKKELVAMATDCLSLLDKATQGNVATLLSGVKELSLDSACTDVVNKLCVK